MKRKWIIPILLLAFVIGCAALKPVEKWSAKEKAAWMMSIYNAQYDLYQVQSARPNLTDSQREILRMKKKILVEVYPLIKLYAGYAESGKVPSITLENQVMVYIEKLMEVSLD